MLTNELLIRLNFLLLNHTMNTQIFQYVPFLYGPPFHPSQMISQSRHLYSAPNLQNPNLLYLWWHVLDALVCCTLKICQNQA